MDEKERSRALGATLSQIEKQFGKGSVIRLGAQPVVSGAGRSPADRFRWISR